MANLETPVNREAQVRTYSKMPPKHGAWYLFHHFWTRAALHDSGYEKKEWLTMEETLIQLGARPTPRPINQELAQLLFELGRNDAINGHPANETEGPYYEGYQSGNKVQRDWDLGCYDTES